MKDYQKHIRHTHAEKKRTAWCGAALTEFDWTFQDIDHAAYTVMNGSFQQPCPECVKAVVETLEKAK